MNIEKQRTQVLREIRKMPEAMEDSAEYLDLLEARALNRGKPTHPIHEVKKRPGIKQV